MSFNLRTYRPARAPGPALDAGQIHAAEHDAALRAADELLRQLEEDPLARVRPAHIPPPRRETTTRVRVLVSLQGGEDIELDAQIGASSDEAFGQWLDEMLLQLTDPRFPQGTFVRIGDQVLHTFEIRRIRRLEPGQSRLGAGPRAAHPARDVPAAGQPSPHAGLPGHPEPERATPSQSLPAHGHAQLDHADAEPHQPAGTADPAARPASERRPRRRRATDAADAPDAADADAGREPGPGAGHGHAADGAARPARSRGR